MTVDISKINVGDEVLVKGWVIQVEPRDGVKPICVSFFGGNYESCWPGTERFISHTPAPREFKAGDRVTWGDGVNSYELIARLNGEICIFDGVCLRILQERALVNLRHADEQQP